MNNIVINIKLFICSDQYSEHDHLNTIKLFIEVEVDGRHFLWHIWTHFFGHLLWQLTQNIYFLLYLLITPKLTNQHVQKALFLYVEYTKLQ